MIISWFVLNSAPSVNHFTLTFIVWFDGLDSESQKLKGLSLRKIFPGIRPKNQKSAKEGGDMFKTYFHQTFTPSLLIA